MDKLYIWSEIDYKFSYWLEELNMIKEKINSEKTNDKVLLKSLFVYSISLFENAINDILEHYFHSFPEKIPSGNRQELSISDVLSIDENDLVTKCIEKALYNSGMQGMNKGFFKVLDIQQLEEEDINQLIEIKETRNLIIHHNLKITGHYVGLQNKRCKDCQDGEYLEFDFDYVNNSLSFIYNIFYNKIYVEMKNKYQSFNKIRAMKEVWRMYAPGIMKFDKVWECDENNGTLKDINSNYVREWFNNLSTGEQIIMMEFLLKYHGNNPFRNDDNIKYSVSYNNVYYLNNERQRLVIGLRDILIKHSTLFEKDNI